MSVNQINYWVLRERATRRLLPVNKCGSRAEFEDKGPPRLFTSAQAASSCLNCWRMGHWRNDMDEYGDGDGPVPSEAKYNIEIKARRQATEVDIVMVSLLSVPS
jgi:hypothetical protein